MCVCAYICVCVYSMYVTRQVMKSTSFMLKYAHVYDSTSSQSSDTRYDFINSISIQQRPSSNKCDVTFP